jgi:hypothetical protein
MLKSLLIELGWDTSKLYNVGAELELHGTTAGAHRLSRAAGAT